MRHCGCILSYYAHVIVDMAIWLDDEPCFPEAVEDLEFGGVDVPPVKLNPPQGVVGLAVAAGVEAVPGDAMQERASAPGGCWKLASIRLHLGTGGPR
jgi:hypothetical protein